MKLAIWEIYKGLEEWILIRDKRRLRQVCHYLKRGLIIVFTLSYIIPKKIDYYET